MSGYSREQTVDDEFGANAHFIQKPFTREQLVRKVRSVLDLA